MDGNLTLPKLRVFNPDEGPSGLQDGLFWTRGATGKKALGRLLSADESPIDRDQRAGHIVGQIGRKELDHLGTILDRPKPPNQFGSITVALNTARNDVRHDPPRSRSSRV